jgi:hypothetical protein
MADLPFVQHFRVHSRMGVESEHGNVDEAVTKGPQFPVYSYDVLSGLVGMRLSHGTSHATSPMSMRFCFSKVQSVKKSPLDNVE